MVVEIAAALRSARIGLLALVACALVPATPVFAQRENGPYAGLFGATSEHGTGTGLDFRGSIFGAWDDVSMKRGDPSLFDSTVLDSHTGGGAAGSLSFFRHSTTTRFNASGGSEIRFYPDADKFSAMAHSANTDLETQAWRYVTLRTHASALYSSYYVFTPFLEGGAIGPGLNTTPDLLNPGYGFAAAAEPNTRYDAGGGFTVQTSRRSNFAAGALWTDYRFPDREDFSYDTRNADGTFHYQLTRPLGLRAGYAYTEARYNDESVGRVTLQTIDAGVDYRDAISFARRTALSFGTSTMAAKIGDRTHFRVNGDVILTRGFRRSWSAQGGYMRDVGFMAGFLQPVLSDSVAAGVGGLLHPRLHWSSGVAYSRGTVGFDSDDTFRTYTGTTRLEVGIARPFGVYGQYTYYYYNVPPGSGSAQIVPQFARQAASVGLMVWLPIISDMRSPRDTR